MRRMKVWTSHATQGWVRPDPPLVRVPFRGRLGAIAAALLVAPALASCSSAGGTGTTPVTAPVRVPSPFEVGQRIGLGDLALSVPSFRHTGGTLTVDLAATNGSGAPVTIDPARDVTLYYASRRWPATVTAGSGAPIPPGGSASYSFRFQVPARYRYPLLWFARATGTPATVVLRGDGQ